MHFKTRVSLKQADAETVRKALEWCSYCQSQDPTFKYACQGNFIIITSPTRNQAYKRGSAMYKRFKTPYNVEKVVDNEPKV
jgi:hypothetical protein